MSDQPAASSPAPVETAFSVLREAVSQTTYPGHVPRASQVRLAMKRLTYDGFKPEDLGFSRFRDFLLAAQEAGHVTMRDQPGDVQVLLPGSMADSEETRRRVKRDIWRAFVDWNPDALHILDLDSRRVVAIPKDPVDLEPTRFSEVRQRLDEGDSQLVRIPSVAVGEQLRWMRQFADEVDDSSLKNLLLNAISGDKPAKTFTSLVRADSAEQRKWNQFFGSRVLGAVTAWVTADDRVSEDEIFETEVPSADVEDAGDEPTEMTSATRHFIDAASRLVSPRHDFHVGHKTLRTYFDDSAERRLRALAHRAIDRMSESELRALKFPLGSLADED